MISSRQYVPDYYGKSRDFQVFLKLLDIVVDACEGDTTYFPSLISPDHCKARLLPWLCSYVGYTYDYEEKVKLNRLIIKNWSLLKRDRGSLKGIRLAIALALSTLENLDAADIYNLFNVQRVTETDEWGRVSTTIRVYLYHYAYLSKLYDLVEAVRPAGVKFEIVPAVPLTSTDTVVLTDEFRMAGYNYATGKLLRIGNIPIYIENSWEILQNGVSTGQYLVDNEFYDVYHNSLKLALDSYQRIISTVDGSYTGELIKAPNIYKEYIKIQNDATKEVKVVFAADSLDAGWTKIGTDHLEFTGKSFNLEHSARVLNTCYEIKCGGKPNGYYVYADSLIITDAAKSRVQFYLKDYILDGVLVKKVYSTDTDEMYEWHVDPESGYFINDGVGKSVNAFSATVPWDEHCYMSKKRYVINTTAGGLMYTTEYFVNNHEDIQDSAGNIILSKKDRYKVSDSANIGFSEVHNLSRPTTYDKTWIYAYDRPYKNDAAYATAYLDPDYNDYVTDSGYVDERIAIRPQDFEISNIYREYDGTNNIGEVSLEARRIDSNNSAKVYIPVSCVDGNTQNLVTDAYIKLNVMLRPEDSITDVFSKLQFTFSTTEACEKCDVFLDWKLTDKAAQFYNVYELPDRLVFTGMGKILPRTLTFESDGTPLMITPKVYDGTVTVESNFSLTSDVVREEE